MTRPILPCALIVGLMLCAAGLGAAVALPSAAMAQLTGRGAAALPDNPPPARDPLPAGRPPGLHAPASAKAGTCPNPTSYAYDPRTDRCVSLPPCAGGMIWNPDKNRCVPRPPGGVLECLGGYEFDTSKDACVAPNCGSLEFNPQQGQCVPRPPVVCAAGMQFDPRQNRCVAEAYDVLQFVIGTGGDDLRSSSSAWALWTGPTGNTIYCTLHGGGDGWGENSSHAVLCDLGASPMTLAQLKSTRFSIAYNGVAAPGSGGFNVDTTDNWNLQSVAINAVAQGEAPVCVFAASGDPLHRFQAVSGGPTFYDPNLTQGVASDGIIVTDYPGGCR